MRPVFGALLVATLAACHNVGVPDPPSVRQSATLDATPTRGFTSTLNLMQLDGHTVPTRYTDTRGTYTLNSGEMRLEPDGRLWLLLDLEGTDDYSSGPTGRTTLMTTYRRIGADSLEFPSDPGHVPEFFGRFRGTQLIVVAKPTRKSGVVSMAREHGGPHTWYFATAR